MYALPCQKYIKKGKSKRISSTRDYKIKQKIMKKPPQNDEKHKQF